jgi:hypothetical protein
MPMLNDTTKECFAQSVSEPYSPSRPLTGGGLEADATLRIAHALEYIAAQLGQINSKFDKLTQKPDGGEF